MRAYSMYLGILDNPSSWIDYIRGARMDYGYGAPPHPPLTYLVTFPFFALFGPTIGAGQGALLLFSVVFLASVFALGRQVADTTAGLLAAALAAASPMARIFGSQYYLDLPLSAMTALSLLFLLRSRGFGNRKASLLFGGALGMMSITKIGSLIFIGALLPVAILLSWRTWVGTFAGPVAAEPAQHGAGSPPPAPHRPRKRDILVNVALSLSVCASVAQLWWYSKISENIELGQHFLTNGSGDTAARLLRHIGLIASALAFYQFPPFTFLLLLLGLPAAIVVPSLRRQQLPLAIFLIAGTLLLALVNMIDVRYALPLLGPGCVLAVGWIRGRSLRRLAGPIIGAVCIFCSINWIFAGQRLGGGYQPSVRDLMALGNPSPFSLPALLSPQSYSWLYAKPGKRDDSYQRLASDLKQHRLGGSVGIFLQAGLIEEGATIAAYLTFQELRFILGYEPFSEQSEDLFVVTKEDPMRPMEGLLNIDTFEKIGSYHPTGLAHSGIYLFHRIATSTPRPQRKPAPAE